MLKLLLALALGGGGEGCTIKCEEIWNEVQTAAEDAGAGKYPDNVPPPNGPTQLLNGNTYKAARDAVDLVNKGIRRRAGDELDGLQVHEILPVKWGGSVTDLANKNSTTTAPPQPSDYMVEHSPEVPWWIGDIAPTQTSSRDFHGLTTELTRTRSTRLRSSWALYFRVTT
jgi:hypothetical protein